MKNIKNKRYRFNLIASLVMFFYAHLLSLYYFNFSFAASCIAGLTVEIITSILLDLNDFYWQIYKR